jgi:phosphodiesterase/alkaline phosphatase D-like protein
MNKTTAITIVSIVVLLLIGGLMYFSNIPINLTPSEIVNNVNSGDETQTQAYLVGIPIVITRKGLPTDTTAVLTGQVIPNGASTNYWYEYGSTSELGSKTNSQILGSGFTNFNAPAYIIGLSKNTEYFFRIVAENRYGKVVGTKYSFKTTEGVASPVGSAPSVKTLSASNITDNSVNLNGEIDPNQADTEYWFEYGKTASLGDNSAPTSIGNGNNTLSESVSVSGLDSGTVYFFRVNGQNQFGTVNGSVLNFKTSGVVTKATAPKVVNQKASNVTVSSATLHAVVSSNGEDTSYHFEYSTSSVFSTDSIKNTAELTLIANTSAVSVKSDISDLKPNTNYYFRLVAKNSIGTTTSDSSAFKTSKK